MDNSELMGKLKLGEAIQDIKDRFGLEDKQILKLLNLQKQQINANIERSEKSVNQKD